MFVCFSEEQTQQKEVEEEEEALTGKDEEERRIAEMGRPMLGDHVKLEVIIEESYEFKVRLVFLFVFLVIVSVMIKHGRFQQNVLIVLQSIHFKMDLVYIYRVE